MYCSLAKSHHFLAGSIQLLAHTEDSGIEPVKGGVAGSIFIDDDDYISLHVEPNNSVNVLFHSSEQIGAYSLIPH